jgi:hypothetical protein
LDRDGVAVANLGCIARWAGLAVLAAAGTAVFWAFGSLAFQDLPAHAGLIALRHRFDHSPFEQRYFVVEPHLGPYSVFRFLGDVLVAPLGPVGAVRMMATLPFLATPLALWWARRRLHGDGSPTAAFLGVGLGFGLMTLFGFASYLLGLAALVALLTLWLELLVAADTRRPAALHLEVAVAFLAPLLFVAHGHAFVLFLFVATATALAARRRSARALRLRSLLPAVALAAWSAWRDRASFVPAGSAPVPHASFAPHFQGPVDKLSLLVTPTLLTRTGLDVAVGIALWIVLGAGVIATARALPRPMQGTWAARSAALDLGRAGERASESHARALLVALAAVGAAFVLLPHSIGWFGFVDGRLVPILLLLAAMAIRRPALDRGWEVALDLVAPAAALAMVAIALTASYAFQPEAAGWREVLARVPEDARLLNLPIDPNSRVFTAHPFVHYDKLVLADRPVVVSDLWFHQGSAVFPTAADPALALPPTYSESDLRVVDWLSYDLTSWDYVLIRTRPTAAPPRVPPELALEAHQGGWWLYHSVVATAEARRP